MRRRALFKVLGTPGSPVLNTFIGGVAASIPDVGTLAAVLGISSSDIGNFVISGSHIAAAVNADYILPSGAFDKDHISTATYFYDETGKVMEVGASCFFGNKAIKRAYFPAAIKLGQNSFNQVSFPSLLYIPESTQLGNFVTAETVFYASSITKIYANTFLQTANSGAMEGDLASAQSFGSGVVFVLDDTKPADISDLTYSGGTLNFTVPPSVNAISGYEVWKNNSYHSVIGGSGAAFSAVLGDVITVKPYDIYFNRSTSNEITV